LAMVSNERFLIFLASNRVGDEAGRRDTIEV
jgi:hypothetical protein